MLSESIRVDFRSSFNCCSSPARGCSRAAARRSAARRRRRGDRRQAGYARVPALKLLETVVRGVLVDVAERGEAERGLDEEVERALERDHGHADVDQLARTLSDDRRAEHALVLAIEQQLHEAVDVAEDLATRIVPEARAAGLV